MEEALEEHVVVGNECADALAKRGSELGKLGINEELRLGRSDTWAWLVQRSVSSAFRGTC